ncbi:MAG: flagellar M-ring protein FliF, partial [Firmicutes bacterium]|nr:flagellar M-ring protein FliF [Bacillota bacterium]
IAAVSFLVLVGLLYIAFRPNYVTVFHGLTLEDAAAITAELEAKRISTKLENAGTAIAVPRKQADLARLEAAAAGLPRSGRVGYELFNKSSFSMTESERALQQQLLLEEQLALTLTKIANIQDAEVKLALPKENVFLDPKRQTEATASVWIKSTTALDSGQVAGVVHLVSRAVPNLAPENVTVIDAEGRVLNSGTEQAGPSFSEQHSRQQALQLDLERSITTLLGQIFGEENVAVRVTAELDFNQRSTETVRFESPGEGEEGLIRQIEELSDYYSGEGTAGAPPGTDTNPGEVTQSPASGTSRSESEKRQRTIAYELDEIRETITYSPGAIKRLSVSVIINETDVVVDTARVQAAVEAAVGYDAERSDVVSVQTMKFADQEAPPTPVAPPWYSSLAVQVGIGVLLAILALLIVRFISRRRQQALLQELQAAQVAATVEQEAEEEARLPEQQEDKSEALRKHLERLARQQPEDFAFIIRAWLNEES